MSLTSFLNDNLEARNYLSKTFAKPSIPNDLRLLVPSNSPRPGEIGAAFDYVFRFYLERLNPQAAPSPWVAVHAIQIVEGVDNRLATQGSDAVRDAKETLAEFLKAEGPPSDALLKSAIRLARLDTIYRSSGGFEYLDAPIAEIELAELRALFLGIKPHEWRTEGPCLLNPTFGMASHAIGGADADAIVGSLLVDVKSTKNLTLTVDDWLQLLGYRLLSMLQQVASGEAGPEIDTLGIYFARYGHLARWDVNQIGTEAVWREAVNWLAAALDIRLPTR